MLSHGLVRKFFILVGALMAIGGAYSLGKDNGDNDIAESYEQAISEVNQSHLDKVTEAWKQGHRHAKGFSPDPTPDDLAGLGLGDPPIDFESLNRPITNMDRPEHVFADEEIEDAEVTGDAG